MTPYCKDCRHFFKPTYSLGFDSGPKCARMGPPDPITGESAYRFTSVYKERKRRWFGNSLRHCGPDAQYFEPKAREKVEA